MPYGLKRGCGNLAKFGISTPAAGPACRFVGEFRSGDIGEYQFGILSKLHWACCGDVSNQHDSHKDVNCFDCSDVAEKKQLRDTIK